MAPTNRRPVPRKRPAPQADVLRQRAADDASKQAAAAANGDQASADLQRMIEELLSDFDALLRKDPNLDADDRERLKTEFKTAAENAVSGGTHQLVLPDKAQMLETVAGLQNAGALSEREAIDLSRTLDEALKPLERRETQLAVEFARRMQSDGKESALAWLQEQQEKTAEEASRSKMLPEDRGVKPLRGDIVKSRSRRSRAPPRLG